MKEIDLNKLKEIEFNILSFIDDLCRKNSINYSLAGGTLLGAVRHKGFIPWDDDIDILMTRDQYEKFIKLMLDQKNERFGILDYRYNKQYNYLFAKVIDKSTILIENHNKAVDDLGVFVDVFPIDAIANTKKEAFRKIRNIKFKRFLAIANSWRHFYFNKNRSLIRQLPRFLFFVLSRFQNVKTDNKAIEQRFPFNINCNYFGCICGSYEEKEIMKKSVFSSFFDIDFESKKFMAIRAYDEYLTNIYGDYLKLPSENKRVAHHTFKAFFK